MKSKKQIVSAYDKNNAFKLELQSVMFTALQTKNLANFYENVVNKNIESGRFTSTNIGEALMFLKSKRGRMSLEGVRAFYASILHPLLTTGRKYEPWLYKNVVEAPFGNFVARYTVNEMPSLHKHWNCLRNRNKKAVLH